MRVVYAIFLFTSVFFFSCNKDSGPTSVEGKVVEMGSNKTVPFAQVELMREKAEFLSSALNIETLQTLNSDADGKFSLHFEADEDYIYSVRAIAVGYDQRLEATPLERGSKNKVDVLLYPFGFIKYHIKNVQNKYNIGFNTNCFNGDYFHESIDTTIICEELANMNYPFRYRLTSFADTISLGNDIYVPAHDTAFITIEY